MIHIDRMDQIRDTFTDTVDSTFQLSSSLAPAKISSSQNQLSLDIDTKVFQAFNRKSDLKTFFAIPNNISLTQHTRTAHLSSFSKICLAPNKNIKTIPISLVEEPVATVPALSSSSFLGFQLHLLFSMAYQTVKILWTKQELDFQGHKLEKFKMAHSEKLTQLTSTLPVACSKRSGFLSMDRKGRLIVEDWECQEVLPYIGLWMRVSADTTIRNPQVYQMLLNYLKLRPKNRKCMFSNLKNLPAVVVVLFRDNRNPQGYFVTVTGCTVKNWEQEIPVDMNELCLQIRSSQNSQQQQDFKSHLSGMEFTLRDKSLKEIISHSPDGETKSLETQRLEEQLSKIEDPRMISPDFTRVVEDDREELLLKMASQQAIIGQLQKQVQQLTQQLRKQRSRSTNSGGKYNTLLKSPQYGLLAADLGSITRNNRSQDEPDRQTPDRLLHTSDLKIESEKAKSSRNSKLSDVTDCSAQQIKEFRRVHDMIMGGYKTKKQNSPPSIGSELWDSIDLIE